jgi:uncharacterized RDD family membrane protein YckC
MELEGQQASPADGDALVISTPERVSFRLETAGLGSRFTAQLIDCLALVVVLTAFAVATVALGALTRNLTVVTLVFLVPGFVVFWGFWIVPEALWSGKSLGKLALHIRVVNTQGGPITVGQAIARNLMRVVDFLPLYYAAGAITIFVSSRNQRLGDLIAGTLVVRDRQAVRLVDLAYEAERSGGPTDRIAPARHALTPSLRRFVIAYAQRRSHLPAARRDQLAREIEPALATVLPSVVAERGPLAALDQLADEHV